ncbi:MAG: EAL domain-containing protein [Eubacterium sp.]|nr:EAL domain-containing protein [Eubacterium sp.]
MDQEAKRRLDEMFVAFSIIGEGAYIYLCNMQEDYSRWSKTAVDYFGLPSEYMSNAGQIWEEHIHPDDREDYRKSIDDIFSGKDPGHDMQYRARARDGSYSICTCRGVVIKDENGQPFYFAGAIKNHGQTSYVDNVTGLRSLYGFFEDLRTMFWKKDDGIVMLIGITGFSAFNDMYGYNFGNSLLTSFSRMLQNKFANTGAVYRMDGVKFAVISHSLNLDEMKAVYADIREYVSGSFFIDKHRVNMTINAGVVVVNNFEISDKTVYSCLKYAYYNSKNSHMGKLCVYSDEFNDNNKLTLEKLNDIRQSVADNCKGFFLCYQPVMNAQTGELKGAEALLRWESERFGIVPPNDFVPVLEQDAMFPTLGNWILRTAMEQGKVFLEKYPDMVININLSYVQLENEEFVENVMNIINETGFPSTNLCFEITERCRFVDMELLKDIVSIFRGYGIKIALDDFGTGFSTLGILRNITVDTVKIDRGFVKDIEYSNTDRVTIKSISGFAESFEAEVCVEGVETEGMINILKEYNISSFQGYYYSKPITFEAFVKKYCTDK